MLTLATVNENRLAPGQGLQGQLHRCIHSLIPFHTIEEALEVQVQPLPHTPGVMGIVHISAIDDCSHMLTSPMAGLLAVSDIELCWPSMGLCPPQQHRLDCGLSADRVWTLQQGLEHA